MKCKYPDKLYFKNLVDMHFHINSGALQMTKFEAFNALNKFQKQFTYSSENINKIKEYLSAAYSDRKFVLEYEFKDVHSMILRSYTEDSAF